MIVSGDSDGFRDLFQKFSNCRYRGGVLGDIMETGEKAYTGPIDHLCWGMFCHSMNRVIDSCLDMDQMICSVCLTTVDIMSQGLNDRFIGAL